MKEWHILLADDDKDDRFFFQKALEEVPVPTRLSTAIDGEKLLIQLGQSLSDLPDVIFLDLNMPRKNGAECLQEIKQDPALKHIPVVIYSTSLHDEVADILFKHGAHYYVQKTTLEYLPSVITEVLNLLTKDMTRPAREGFIIKSTVLK